MSISLWISKNPMQRTLYVAVPSIHLLIIAVSFITSPSLKRSSSKPLVIHTWAPPAPTSAKIKTNAPTTPTTKKSIATPPPASPSKKATPITAQAPAPSKANKTTSSELQKASVPQKEKLAINPKPAAKQTSKTPSAAQKQIREIEERIAKIEAKNDRMLNKSELTVPTTITLSSQTPSQNSLEFTNYQTFATDDAVVSLIGYLQGYLQLPDIGEVQIQLVLRKDGKVESMKVLKTESEANRKYLEEHLPKLSFPLSILERAGSRIFLLTFCNK